MGLAGLVLRRSCWHGCGTLRCLPRSMDGEVLMKAQSNAGTRTWASEGEQNQAEFSRIVPRGS